MIKGQKHSKQTKMKMSISRKGRISGMKGKHHTKEHNEKLSRLMKERGYAPINRFKQSEENKIKIAETLKRKYATGERLPALLGKKASKETLIKKSNCMLGSKNPNWGKKWSTDFKERVSLGLKKYYDEHPEAKIIISNRSKNNIEVINKLKKYRKQMIFPLKDTSIEIKIQSFLKQLGISFFTHQYIKDIEHSYQCDILIPSMNLIIECDGDYWHKYPVGRDIDNIRTKELIEKGFKVLRLWENEIKVMDINKFMEKLI